MKNEELAKQTESMLGLEKQYLTELEAKKLSVKASAWMSMERFQLEFVPEWRGGVRRIGAGWYSEYQMKGQANSTERRIRIFEGGANVAVVLHELAHQKVMAHDEAFWAVLLDLQELWESKLKAEILPEKVKLEAAEAIEAAVEELIDEADGTKVTMKKIGEKLVELGANCQETVLAVRAKLVEFGMTVAVR